MPRHEPSFAWGEPARVLPGAPARFHPGRVACVRGTLFGTDLAYLVELFDDEVVAVPAELLARVLPHGT